MTISGDAPTGPEGDVAAAQLTKEIERLANEMFSGPRRGGGLSPGGEVPVQEATGGEVVPPAQQQEAFVYPPTLPADHPPPPNPDRAAHPSSASSPSAGFSPPSAGGSEGTPYFLDLAGMPKRSESASSPSEQQPSRMVVNDPLPTPTDAPHGSKGGERERPVPFVTELSLHEVEPEAVPKPNATRGIFDPHAVKRDFPILDQKVNGKPLVWLDNAATTQKPNAVIERLSRFYRHENSNVHRAAHTLAARSTDAYEGARQTVRRFLNASSAEEIVFVRGATEGINLVAQSWGRRNVESGDEIVITNLEHHANIVPWQMLCSAQGAKLKVVPVDDTGQVILEEYEKLLCSRTRIVSLPQVSNALGTIVPVREMIEMAHRRGVYVLVDGAQAVSHMPVDVQALDADFYVFSGHKIFAPTGIGVVYGKRDILAAMPPWQGGGNMIADVTFAKTIYQPPPARFEAGTGSIGDAVGLGAALEYLTSLGLPNVERYEHELRVYAEACLREIPGLHLIGTAKDKAGVISFILDGHKTEEVGGLLDLEGIAVRSGHHCAQPILRRFGLESTVRASLAPYNTREDIDALVSAVRRLQVGRPRT